MTEIQSGAPRDAGAVLGMDESQRAAYLQSMGVKNAVPPLPWSPCLKNQKTGVILPWSAMLAEQRDVLVNCDEQGRTDPALWADRLPDLQEAPGDLMDEALREATRKTAEKTMAGMRPTMKLSEQAPADAGYGDAVPYADIENLLAQAEY